MATSASGRRNTPKATKLECFSAEEFSTFLLGDLRVREIFVKHHADLLDPAAWQAKQDRLRAGSIEDVLPYPLSIRFRNLFAAEHRRLPDLRAMSKYYK